ncbi:MAG: TonB-dependent receptor [Sphingomonas sp.]|nr:TonB-dependent receptor [Sphingomonas sp.]
MIEALQPTSLRDPLADLGGVRAFSTGGAAGGSFVSIRGGEPNYTLVLVDGVRVNDITNSQGGAFDFGLLDPAVVARIDVARGAGSAVHGSDALSGVVAIDLLSPRAGPVLGARVIYGDSGRVTTNLTAGAGGASGGIIANAGLFDSGTADGTRLQRQTALLRARRTVAGIELGLLGLYAHTDRRGFPEDSGGPRLARNRAPEIGAGALWLTALTAAGTRGALRPHLSISYSEQRNDTDSPAIFPGVLNGVPAIRSNDRLRRFEAIGYWRYARPGATVSIGGAVLDERGGSSGAINLGVAVPVVFARGRTTPSAFAEMSLDPWRALRLNLAGRYDAPPGVGDKFTGRAAIDVTPLAGGPVVFARIGTAFKLPSFYALGHPLVGNAALLPERSRDIEAGLRWARGDAFALRLSWFDNRFTNLIDFDPIRFRLVNRGLVTTRGVDGEARARFDRLTLVGAFGYVAIDSATRLRGRPGWQGSLRGAFAVTPRLTLNGGGRFNSSYFDSSVPTGQITVPGHVEGDIGARYRWRQGITLDLALRDIGDARAPEAVGFRAIGRELRVTLNFLH